MNTHTSGHPPRAPAPYDDHLDAPLDQQREEGSPPSPRPGNMDGKEKNPFGFIGSLWRRGSLSLSRRRRKSRGDRETTTTYKPRRASETDLHVHKRERTSEEARLDGAADGEKDRTRWRPEQRPANGHHGVGGLAVQERKSSGRSLHGKSRTKTIGVPLVAWPPAGMDSQEELLPKDALDTIARGVPSHRGLKRPIPHAGDAYFMLYTTSSGNYGEGAEAGDRADMKQNLTDLSTMRRCGRGTAGYPWQTLEQPSCGFYYGRLPGTITLNHWVSQCSRVPRPMELRDAGDLCRELGLEKICERLKELQYGLEDDDPTLLYKITYRRILREPDDDRRRKGGGRRSLDRQITDLIQVLSRPGQWTDFSDPRNHVVTRFLFDTSDTPENTARWTRFLHQVLLSLELELRITSPLHPDGVAEKLTAQLPPTIQWSVAVARRWRRNVRIQDFGDAPGRVLLRFKSWKAHVRTLERFAGRMKWPNLAEFRGAVDGMYRARSFATISSDAYAFFSGLVLPGPSLPFITMNTLIDLDPSPSTDALALLSHVHPNCGFQYRNSYTYWSATCIVGKVLAPTALSLAGWIGPARPTKDLARSQMARIHALKPRDFAAAERDSRLGGGGGAQGHGLVTASRENLLSVEDVESMAERSDALGPPAEVYPVSDYELVLLDDNGGWDTVRIELLHLDPLEPEKPGAPGTFAPTIQFAVAGASLSVNLTYDVSFISAWPCSDGPHLLFFDYAFRKIRADEILDVTRWGGARSTRTPHSPLMGPGRKHPPGPGAQGPGHEQEEEEDFEKVLVVEAFGARDNEVLARAWCAEMGLSAVVADVRGTCVACAVREAYAALVTVVVLIDGEAGIEEDGSVG